MSSGLGDSLRRVRIDASEREDLAWAAGMDVTLPESLVRAAALDASGRVVVPAAVPAADPVVVDSVRLHAAFTPVPPTSSRLPVSYQRVPAALRQWIARAIGRRARRRAHEWAAFPRWPLDLSADFCADLLAQGRRSRALTPVLLTHDLDSAEGLRNLVDTFLAVEERLGARSTNFVVPCGWPIDEGLLTDITNRGHELGIHGHDHANRTPFAPPRERQARLDAARPLIERFGMSGYRAPSLLRTRALIEDLAARYTYDSSIPTSGGLFPVPNNGCASARPFRLGGLIEIPVSLPRDGSLRFLGHGPAEILDIWTRCADRIARSGGVVVLLTHCERHFSGNAPMIAAYTSFLDWVAQDGRFAWSTGAAVAAAALA